MKQLILKVRDKTKVPRLQAYCNVLYVSKFVNTVGIEIDEKNISHLVLDENIISYTESIEGTFQSI